MKRIEQVCMNLFRSFNRPPRLSANLSPENSAVFDNRARPTCSADTHPTEAGHRVEPADRQDREESDDVYVKQGLQNRRLRVALRLDRGVGVRHVQQPAAFLLGAAATDIAGGHQTRHRVKEGIVLGRQHLAHVLLLEQTRQVVRRGGFSPAAPGKSAGENSPRVRLRQATGAEEPREIVGLVRESGGRV